MPIIQEIAQSVEDPANTWEGRHLSKTAPGKAQQMVLDALGISANNYAHAEEIFQELGIIVNHKRVGRRSVPVVTRRIEVYGGFNEWGEGEGYEGSNSDDLDLSALSEWWSD